MPVPQNLILGLAAGYHFGDLAPFVLSWKAVAPKARLVLFTSPTTRHTTQLRDLGVEVVPFERPAEFENVPYNGYRYRLYREYLRTHDESFERILLTDVRDVLFQSDPFAFAWSPGINATLEAPGMTIGRCPHNSHWVENHLGPQALDFLRDEPISCSGTTVADQETLLEYLDAMIEQSTGFSPGNNMAGFDQAIHNILIRKEFDSKTTFHDNAGPILTLGYHPGEPECDASGLVLNASGKPAVIVHQYDRKPKLFRQVRERFMQ